MVSPGPRPAPSSDLVGLRKGEEVFLLYGHHSNQDLFVEYGFVDMTTNGSSDANTNDAVVPKDICIDNAAIALFENTDQNLHSRDKKALLQSKGYWGYVLFRQTIGPNLTNTPIISSLLAPLLSFIPYSL